MPWLRLGMVFTSLLPRALPYPLTLPWSLPLAHPSRWVPLLVPSSPRRLPPRPTLCWILRLVVLAVVAATRWGA